MLKHRFLKLWPRIFLLYTIFIVCYNEFLVYTIHRFQWKNIPCLNASCTRILFVADPQILGETFDRDVYQRLAIFDSDRYLRNTFIRAVAHTEPNVICFMGDLMDEGSVASASEYVRYLDRFRNIYQIGNNNYELMHIPGDNDIGGERTDLVTEFKTNRFKQAFGERSYLDIGNLYRLLNVNLLTHKYPDVRDADIDDDIETPINIVLTHISLLSFPGYFTDTITTKFKPEVIFSAHLHISRLITYPPMRFESINDNSILTFTLKGNGKSSQEKKFNEIMIPTCSYRMGVKRIGFGMAVLDGHNLHYAVLWLPDRFFCLWWYVVWLGLLFISIIFWLLIKRPISFRKNYNRHHHRLLKANEFY